MLCIGMNTGIQDAHNLAWKLAAVVNSIAPTRLLNTYETERKPVLAYLFWPTFTSLSPEFLLVVFFLLIYHFFVLDCIIQYCTQCTEL